MESLGLVSDTTDGVPGGGKSYRLWFFAYCRVLLARFTWTEDVVVKKTASSVLRKTLNGYHFLQPH